MAPLKKAKNSTNNFKLRSFEIRLDRITNTEEFLKKLKLAQSGTVKPMVMKSETSFKLVSVNQSCARKTRSKSMREAVPDRSISKRIMRPPKRFIPMVANAKSIDKSKKAHEISKPNVRKASKDSETSAKEKVIKKPILRARSESVFIESVAKTILKKWPAVPRQRSKSVCFDLQLSPGSNSEEPVDVQSQSNSLPNNRPATSNHVPMGSPNVSNLNEQRQNISFGMEVEVATSNNDEQTQFFFFFDVYLLLSLE